MRTLNALSLCVVLFGCTSLTTAEDEEKTETADVIFTDAQSVPASGDALPGLEAFDEAVRKVLAEQNIPGTSLALIKDGRLIYARGFGYSDLEKKEVVQADAMFRIASVTKPMTAVAIMMMIEDGTLSMDDRIVDLLTEQPFFHEDGPTEMDERWKTITIAQCLRHTGGWDRDKAFDAMFQTVRFGNMLGEEGINGGPPAEPRDIIRVMMGFNLDFDPGSKYVYSNFGYSILGRIMENKTGKPYDQVMHDMVFKPLGMKHTFMGRSLIEDRIDGEVRYYPLRATTGQAVMGPRIGKEVPYGYGTFYQEALDAHGGFIGSAIDIARFGSAFVDSERSPLLKKETIELMFARPDDAAGYDDAGKPKESYYACGWQIRENGRIRQHGGSLPGTATRLAILDNGVTMCYLMNRRYNPDMKWVGTFLDGALKDAAENTRQWPEGDLFEKYGYKKMK